MIPVREPGGRRAVVRAMLASVTTLTLGAAPAPVATAISVSDLGARLERFAYPWPVHMMPLTIVGEPAEMAYMDVAPVRPNGRTVVLLHGKNFCGATWESTARALGEQGFRVLIPDQIGFCKSSKPPAAQYSIEMLAANTLALMRSVGVERAVIVGHSMGGMIAMRFAIDHPQAVERLVLVAPLGLDDAAERGVPYVGVDALWAGERKASAASIAAYQRENYYHGTWRSDYDRWVAMQAGMLAGEGRETVSLAQAKTAEMIRTQPVAHELERIRVPTTLIVGALDRTAFGRAQAPAALRAGLPTIPQVAPNAVRRIAGARLVRLDGLGHAPQVEDPRRFEATLLGVLG